VGDTACARGQWQRTQHKMRGAVRVRGCALQTCHSECYGFMLRFTQCVCEVRPCVALWRVEKYAYADIIGRAVRAF